MMWQPKWRVKRSPMSRGQRLAGRRARSAARPRSRAGSVGRREHAGEAGRRTEERSASPSGAGSLRPGPALEHRVRASAARPSARTRRADRERERQRVAEAVREEELRRREADVASREPEDALAVELGGPLRLACVCTVPFGLPGRARRVEPERRVVGARRGRRGERLARGEQRARMRPRPAARRSSPATIVVAHLVRRSRASACASVGSKRARRRSPPARGCARACRRSRRRSAAC